MLMSLTHESLAEPISPAIGGDCDLSEQTDPHLLAPELDLTLVKGQMADDAMSFGQEECQLRKATRE